MSAAQTRKSKETAPRPTLTERRASKREEIMAVAKDMFARKGYAGTTVDDVCEGLGITKPTLYHYFKDKQELFDSICHASVESTMSVFQTTDVTGLSTKEKLEACLRELNRRTIDGMSESVLSYRDSHYLSDETRKWMQGRARDFHKSLAAVLEQGKAEGVFSYTDVRVASHAISGIVGYLYTWYKKGGPLRADQVVAQLTEAMMKTVARTEP